MQHGDIITRAVRVSISVAACIDRNLDSYLAICISGNYFVARCGTIAVQLEFRAKHEWGTIARTVCRIMDGGLSGGSECHESNDQGTTSSEVEYHANDHATVSFGPPGSSL
jgi:hypothetical protein